MLGQAVPATLPIVHSSPVKLFSTGLVLGWMSSLIQFMWLYKQLHGSNLRGNEKGVWGKMLSGMSVES